MKPASVREPIDPATERGVLSGDFVYFNHPKLGPQSGRVLTAGRDGMTLEHAESPDGRCQVEWKHMLGHKQRTPRKLRLVERGEDGGIAQDETGKNVFLAGDIPIAEAELSKSLEAASVLAQVPEPLALRDRAVIDAALIRAGFEPSIEYIRATYGDHWNPRETVATVSYDDAPIVNAIGALRAEFDTEIRALREYFGSLGPNDPEQL